MKSKEECSGCRYFERIGAYKAETIGQGSCRRFPPVRVSEKEEDGDDQWFHFDSPIVADDGWCGEWRADGRP